METQNPKITESDWASPSGAWKENRISEDPSFEELYPELDEYDRLLLKAIVHEIKGMFRGESGFFEVDLSSWEGHGYSVQDFRELIDARLIERIEELERRLHSLESRCLSLHGI